MTDDAFTLMIIFGSLPLAILATAITLIVDALRTRKTTSTDDK